MVTIEPLLFTGVGGFAIGYCSGYALRKILKLAMIIVGIFVAAMAYLAWKNVISVNNDQLVNMSNQAIHIINNTAGEIMTQTAQHTANGVTLSAPVTGILGFLPGMFLGFRAG